MARYLRHEACEACGSRDNKAVYSDGSSWCFGCRHYVGTNGVPWATNIPDVQTSANVRLPSDADFRYSQSALDWVNKYEITVLELLNNKIQWSNSKNYLIFPWYDETGNLLAWQARCFHPSTKRKYHSQGDLNALLPVYSFSGGDSTGDYHPQQDRRLVLVEDCLSAIKISRYMDCMPCLTSDLSKEKLTRLRPFYDRLTIFLDGDMYPNACRLAQRASFLGFQTDVIYSNEDPKDHTDSELIRLLA